MKTTLRMSRWFGAVAALLLLAVSSFTLTSCGDDDDDVSSGSITFDGEKPTITSVEVEVSIEYADDGSEVKCYYIYLDATDADGNEGYVEIDLAGPLFGKTLNLAEDQTYRDEDGDAIWFTGIGIESSDVDEFYWTDENDFKSGTLYVSKSGGTLVVKAQGVTSDDESFSINYSGKYTVDSGESKVKGEVKAKAQAKKNK